MFCEYSHTAKFLQKFIALENSLCTLFVSDARQQLHGIFMQFGKNIQTACQLRKAIYSYFLIIMCDNLRLYIA